MWHQPSEISPFANLWSFPQFSCLLGFFFTKSWKSFTNRSRERSAFLLLNQKHSHVHLTQSGVSFNTVGNHITRLVPAAHDTGSGPIHAVMKRDSTPNPFKTPSPPCSTWQAQKSTYFPTQLFSLMKSNLQTRSDSNSLQHWNRVCADPVHRWAKVGHAGITRIRTSQSLFFQSE